MKPPVFRKEFTVSSYELDPRGTARLTTMANYLQEAAYHHANELGLGYHQMKERRTTWLLSRLRIIMNWFPVWEERIVVETWPSGIDKLFAIRDFRVKDMEGKELGAASTCWLIVNLDSHRPVRPIEELERYARIIYGDSVFQDPLLKLDLPGTLAESDRHQVAFSDLDIVGHVNNVKYMEWIIDSAMKGGSSDRQLRQFEINFMKEARFGDQVLVKSDPGRQYYAVTRQQDEKEVCRALLRWE